MVTGLLTKVILNEALVNELKVYYSAQLQQTGASRYRQQRFAFISPWSDICSHEYGKKFSCKETAHAQQNAKTTVPLDVVPERRTKRCSPRFRPGDRFCEPSFRYLSPGSEGEKCGFLDPMWQIPFIHLPSFAISISKKQCSSYILHVVRSSVSWYGAYLRMCPFFNTNFTV